ncbi:hypothetical protein D3C83_292950 [compost metagenome]
MIFEFSDAPVDYKGFTELTQQHVLRLDIPVEYTAAVGVRDRLAQIEVARQQP